MIGRKLLSVFSVTETGTISNNKAMPTTNPSTPDITSFYKHWTPHPDGVIRGLQIGERECWAIVLQCIVILLLWASAVFGNILVCLVIQRSRRVQSTTNYFVKSMAYSDIVLVLVTSPLVCIRLIRNDWETGHIACRLVRFSQLFSMACTSFILMAICFDRFYTIIYPLSFKVTRGTAKRMIVISWIVAAAMSSLSLCFFDEVSVPRYPFTNSDSVRHICPTFIPVHHWTGKIYSCVLVFVHFLFPVLAVALGYSRVIYYIHRTRIKVQIRRTSSVVPRNKVKMVKTLFILTVSTLLLFSPFFMVQLFYCFNQRTFLSPDIFLSAHIFISFSAALKPVLYACRNSNFWRGCKEMLCMSGMNCYRLNAYTITTASRFGKKNFVGIMDLSREQTAENISPPPRPVSNMEPKNVSPWGVNGISPTTSF